MLNIAVTTPNPELETTAHALAARLKLPIAANNHKYDYLLILTTDYLGLQKMGGKFKPLIIDFLSKELQFRCKKATLRNEKIAKALGLKNKSAKKIIDATAGLARDSFILASLGFEVTLLERSPIIFALLQDGLNRAHIDRLHLIHADTIQWLKNPPFVPDIIYLDPMFPESKKSALSKQNMRIFHDIVGDDLDADALIKTALTCAKERVVVKRPRLAQCLAGLTPTFSMEGSSNRFDIYLI